MTYEAARWRVANVFHRKVDGMCWEYCHLIHIQVPELTVVWGDYYCSVENLVFGHFWLIDEKGGILDPTADQFKSRGSGTYTQATRQESWFNDCST